MTTNSSWWRHNNFMSKIGGERYGTVPRQKDSQKTAHFVSNRFSNLVTNILAGIEPNTFENHIILRLLFDSMTPDIQNIHRGEYDVLRELPINPDENAGIAAIDIGQLSITGAIAHLALSNQLATFKERHGIN